MHIGTMIYAAVGYADHRLVDSWTRLGGIDIEIRLRALIL